MARKIGERKKKQEAIINTYRLKPLDDSPDFKICYRDPKLNKKFKGLLVAYQIIGSDWYMFKNDTMGKELYFCCLSQEKFYSLEAFISTNNASANIKSAVIRALDLNIDGQ